MAIAEHDGMEPGGCWTVFFCFLSWSLGIEEEDKVFFSVGAGEIFKG